MQFNVAQLLQEAVGTIQKHTLDVTLEPSEDTQSDHVWGQVQFMHVSKGIWVSGLLNANGSCVCSRCLQAYQVSLQFALNEVYFPVLDINTGTPQALPEDADPDCTVDEHHILDITEAVRQSLIVAVPMKPLCRPDCAGLCPECGVDRNRVSCHCQDKNADPRWAPMLKLAR